ncbi:MAG: TAXI family TRAP transporter solute-binding subunit [Desulfobulbaceae bacterium]|nr:TAXI family TRAP transporter solute-binding subunit [Desulfobulbaceae bacterium]
MRKRIITTAIVFLFVTGIAVATSPNIASAGSKRLLSIATASTGGSWYPAGGAVGSLITKYIPNTEASAHPSAASRENIRLLQEKKTDLAMVMPDVAFFAQTGTDIYQGKTPANIKGLFSFWGIDLLIIARADTDIHKIEDLKGHKVGFGPPGSGSETMSKKILAEYGITYKDLKPQFISATEQSQALKDKSLDAAMYTIGTPASTFVDLCTLTKCRIIPIKQDMMKRIIKKYPYYSPSVIPANAYPQIKEDNPALKWVGIIVTYEDLDSDLAYKIVKTVCKDHLDEFKQCHAQAKKLTTEGMSKGMSIPWHPGAARFWKEVGLLK